MRIIRGRNGTTSVQILSMTLRQAIEGTIWACSYSRSENEEEGLSILLSGRVVHRVRIHGRRKIQYTLNESKSLRQGDGGNHCIVS
jgi:hypothetical protein